MDRYRNAMTLRPGNTDIDWQFASRILTETVSHLDATGQPLWTRPQVETSALKQSYESTSLYLLERKSELAGVVFLEHRDELFWPEENDGHSLYLHKLAIRPSLSRQGLGRQALDCIHQYARLLGKHWLRLDCHGGRARLRAFYEANGYQLVDHADRRGFNVARYQRDLLQQGKQERRPAGGHPRPDSEPHPASTPIAGMADSRH